MPYPGSAGRHTAWSVHFTVDAITTLAESTTQFHRGQTVYVRVSLAGRKVAIKPAINRKSNGLSQLTSESLTIRETDAPEVDVDSMGPIQSMSDLQRS